MATFVRRIVSGPKARHVDKDLGVDLDLVYLTDRLIVMGWPGASVEVLYRNNRSTVRKFLDSKHGENYRVFNLCPCWENSYDASEFYGEVGRYPFPDHHPPPLSMIPMFVCDITAWLAAKPENVAVIHCKAGKGRSGTMACSYLLSLPVLPIAKNDHVEEMEMEQDQNSPKAAEVIMGNLLAEHPRVKGEIGDGHTEYEEKVKRAQAAKKVVGDLQDAYTSEALAQRLCSVFEFHSSKRLKRPNTPSFLQEDPSPLRPVKSVSNLMRKASKGFLRSNGDMDGSPSNSAEHSFTSSPIYTPSRNSTSSSQQQSPIARRKSQLDLRYLGVQPMGKSVSDLSSNGFHATVEGWNSMPNLQRQASSGTTRANDNSLAPPVYRPGDKVNALPLGNSSQFSFGNPSGDETDLTNESEQDDENAPVKLAVSIPSQRRFVGYWSRILSGNDARADLPSRKIRITRIQIDRRIKGNAEEQQEDGKKGVGTLSIHLGRYEPELENNLRKWEANARRRTRAFGFSDPSAATPEFPNGHAEDEQWRHVERQNSGQQAYDDKMSIQGASFWGINVLAEQERVRNFAWVNSGHDDLVDKVEQMEASKKETEINTFASVREHSREGKGNVVRHTFQLSGNGDVREGAPMLPHWMKSEHQSSNDVVLDADSALQVKMLIGKSGASHSHLPDMASCGYVWFIPSFESPSIGQGQKVSRTFTAQEIDFRKGKQLSKLLGGEIRRLIVEWEWVDVGETDSDG